MRKWALLPIAVALAIGVGCGDDDDGGGGSSNGGDSGTEGSTIAYISPVAAQPGQQDINLGLERGAEELGWETSTLDANLSPDKQVAAVDTAITKNVDGIGSWSLDPGAVAGAYARAMSGGIPVINLNTNGEDVNGTVWWQHLQCVPGGAGEQSAEFIAERIPGAKTIVMSGPPAPSIVEMTKCFTAAAKKVGLEIVESTANTNDTADAAQRLMADLLTKHPDVQAVWNYNDQSALGDVAALTAAGKKIASADSDGVIVIGHNGDPDAITAIEDGRMTGTWDPNNVGTGMAVIKQLQLALEAGPEKKHPPLTVKGDFWTSENVADYEPAEARKYTLDSLPLVNE
jgi:ribose transport system substrate-binding protein